MTSWRFQVSGRAAARLDSFLAGMLGVSRSALKLPLESARLTVNGQPAKKGAMVKPGDLVVAENVGDLHVGVSPNRSLALEVIYEDADLVAVNKPAGLPSVAVKAKEAQTAASYLAACYPQTLTLPHGKREAGLVHRLDTGTSGLMLAALTEVAYGRLRRAFARGQVSKRYLALVQGRVAQSVTLDLPLCHHPSSARRIVIWRKHAKKRPLPARTRFRPLWHTGNVTLLVVAPVTGVMHQIRVHLAALGHPIVGDPLYGGAKHASVPDLGFFLHAHRLLLAHPREGRKICLKAPLPQSWEGLVNRR